MYTCTSIRRDGVYIYIYTKMLTYHQPAPLIPPSLVSSRLLPSPTGTTSLLVSPRPHAMPFPICVVKLPLCVRLLILPNKNSSWR